MPRSCLQGADLQVVLKNLLAHRPEEDRVTGSPYFAAIICASLIWVTYCWATRLIQGKEISGQVNLCWQLMFNRDTRPPCDKCCLLDQLVFMLLQLLQGHHDGSWLCAESSQRHRDQDGKSNLLVINVDRAHRGVDDRRPR